MKNTIFGIHSIEEALKSEQALDKIFIQKDIEHQSIDVILKLARKENIPISKVPIQRLNKLASGNHQGIAAKTSPIKTIELELLVEKAFSETSTPLFLLLDEISDVRNFGAIIRTAECAGANGIIIPKQGSAAINEQTVKTSAGAAFNMPICKVSHLKDALYFLKSYDVQCIAASERGKSSVYDIDFKEPSAIIMGSEDKGVSNSILKMCAQQAHLPLLGKTESLNVSVAAALFLYEAVRQKR